MLADAVGVDGGEVQALAEAGREVQELAEGSLQLLDSVEAHPRLPVLPSTMLTERSAQNDILFQFEGRGMSLG